MEYKVVLTSAAKIQFRNIINYLLYELESQQAATDVINDFEDTIFRLSHVAGSLKLCDDKILRAKGYRTIHFKKLLRMPCGRKHKIAFGSKVLLSKILMPITVSGINPNRQQNCYRPDLIERT